MRHLHLDRDGPDAFYQPARVQHCGDRLAVFHTDPEHGFLCLGFVDPLTGATLEQLPTLSGEEGGGAVVCRGGDRLVSSGPQAGWWVRDRRPGGWVTTPAAGRNGLTAPLPPLPDEWYNDPALMDEVMRRVPFHLHASADGRTVLLVGDERRGARPDEERAAVWRVADDGTAVPVTSRLTDGPYPGLQAGTVSAGGRPVAALLVDTLEGRSLALWDALGGDPLAEFDLPGGPDPVLRWAADGSRLAMAADGRVALFDPSTWDAPTEVAADPADFALAPDGRLLLVATVDGTTTLWDAVSVTARQSLTVRPPAAAKSGRRRPPPDAPDPLLSVDFAPDGLTAVAGFASGRLLFWDVG